MCKYEGKNLKPIRDKNLKKNCYAMRLVPAKGKLFAKFLLGLA
jgi:hypothetical protein